MNKPPLRPVWPNGWVFLYEPNGSGFESSCSQINLHFVYLKLSPVKLLSFY